MGLRRVGELFTIAGYPRAGTQCLHMCPHNAALHGILRACATLSVQPGRHAAGRPPSGCQAVIGELGLPLMETRLICNCASFHPLSQLRPRT